MTERNENCPCGSGKKYKKCCMNDFRKRSKQIPIKKNLITEALTSPLQSEINEYVRRKAMRHENFNK